MSFKSLNNVSYAVVTVSLLSQSSESSDEEIKKPKKKQVSYKIIYAFSFLFSLHFVNCSKSGLKGLNFIFEFYRQLKFLLEGPVKNSC